MKLLIALMVANNNFSYFVAVLISGSIILVGGSQFEETGKQKFWFER